MQDDGDTEEARRLRELAEQTAAAARPVHQRASGAHERAELAKERELRAHARAIELHEQAADLQDRLGHPDRASRARKHAEHARELWNQALAEQAERDE